MKRILSAAALVAGLTMSASVLAQVPPAPGYPAAPGAPVDPAYDGAVAYDVDYNYRTTGWDPSLLLMASGGLAVGSLALKGALRKRS